jgi:Nucleoside transporter
MTSMNHELFLSKGMSLGGVAVSLASLVSAAYGDPWPFWSAHCAVNRERQLGKQCGAYQKVDESVFLYFFLGSATLGLCMVGFSYIVRLRHREDHGGYDSIAEEPVGPNGTPRIGLELLGAPEARRDELQQSVVARIESDDEPLSPPLVHATGETVEVWNLVQAPAISIFLVFVVTLSLFPAWTSQIQSAQQCQTTSRWRNDLFTPLSFVVFNVGDLAGRLLSSRIPLSTAPYRSRRRAALRLLPSTVFLPWQQPFLVCPQ